MEFIRRQPLKFISVSILLIIALYMIYVGISEEEKHTGVFGILIFCLTIIFSTNPLKSRNNVKQNS